MISLDATSSGTGNTGWLELRPAFSVGAVWSSGETRRPESATRCIRHCWRRAGSRSPSCSLQGGISLRGQAPSGSGVSISWKHLGAAHTPYTWLRLVWSSVEEHRESLFALPFTCSQVCLRLRAPTGLSLVVGAAVSQLVAPVLVASESVGV